MNGGLHGTTSPFYSLERWKPNIRMGNRTVWVHCWGIPLQAWDRNRIRKIVGTMGDIVDVDDDVETKWRMDRARVLIRTPWTPAIKNVIEVHISGETFKVHVVEECGSMTCENHIKGSSYSDSSEEIESSDSLAGDELLRATRFAGANQELPRATAPNQRPNSPHNITVPNAGVGERILTGMTIGWKDDGYLMDNVEVPRLMTGRNGKATVNSNIEAYAAKIPPLESYLNSHESQAGVFHENRQREKGETSGVQRQLH